MTALRRRRREPGRCPVLPCRPRGPPGPGGAATRPAGRRPTPAARRAGRTNATAASFSTSPSGSSRAANGGTVRQRPSRCRPAAGPSCSSVRNRSGGNWAPGTASTSKTTRYAGRRVLDGREQAGKVDRLDRLPLGQLGGERLGDRASTRRPRAYSTKRAAPGGWCAATLRAAVASSRTASGPGPSTARLRPGEGPSGTATVDRSDVHRPAQQGGRLRRPARQCGAVPGVVAQRRTRPAGEDHGRGGALRAGRPQPLPQLRHRVRMVLRVGEPDHPLVPADRAPGPAEPARGVDHRAAHRQSGRRVVRRLQHRTATGQRHPHRELPEHRVPVGTRPQPQVALTGQHQVHPVRPTRPRQRVQPGRRPPPPVGPARRRAAAGGRARRRSGASAGAVAARRSAARRPAPPASSRRRTSAVNSSNRPRRTPGRRPWPRRAPAESTFGPARSGGTPRRTRRRPDPPGTGPGPPGRTGRPGRAARW